ncbi:hypothetical protein T492DRAFT_1063420 [Pavlovales sp. CCMP2436]|nr:hypothetical protein T492DRAFT_1063420 [Pavlovales sp. CCMP2436]
MAWFSSPEPPPGAVPPEPPQTAPGGSKFDPRRTANGYSQKVLDAANATQRFYERRQTLITVTATLASCLAAWWTYTSRVVHQRALEEQLARIHADLESSALNRTSAIAAEIERSRELQREAAAQLEKESAASGKLQYLAPGVVGIFMLGYAAGFRHGRYGRWTLTPRSTPASKPPRESPS